MPPVFTVKADVRPAIEVIVNFMPDRKAAVVGFCADA